jgi:hypothetical protein
VLVSGASARELDADLALHDTCGQGIARPAPRRVAPSSAPCVSLTSRPGSVASPQREIADPGGWDNRGEREA